MGKFLNPNYEEISYEIFENSKILKIVKLYL